MIVEVSMYLTHSCTCHLFVWTISYLLLFPYLYCRNGVVRYESVMKLRNKLDELGKMEGIKEKEKGMY